MSTINKHRLADWSKAPDWAQFHAINPDGDGVWFGTEVREGFVRWYIVPQETVFYTGYFNLSGIDWRETLESRPDPELDRLREENARLHEKLNRLTLDRIASEERHDAI